MVILMLRQRDKVILSLLVALFVVLTMGDYLPQTIPNWWCVMFPGQSPVPSAAGEEAVYGFRTLELLRVLLG